MQFTIRHKAFNSLSAEEVYAILRLRSEVFVVEQKCIFLDMDNNDQYCDHVMLFAENLAGCTRLVPPNVIYPEMSIGRVVTHPTVRRTGAGKLLMDKSIELLYSKYGYGPIRIGAQYYLKRFYESFGFAQSGDIYDEDGIDHIHMLKL
jgi:ElaA protein